MSSHKKRVEELERQINRRARIFFLFVMAVILATMILIALLAPGLIGLTRK